LFACASARGGAFGARLTFLAALEYGYRKVFRLAFRIRHARFMNRPLTSLLLSRWVFNPYQKLLVGHLKRLGVNIAERSKSNFFLWQALLGCKADVLHLQNLRPWMRRNRMMGALHGAFFLCQLVILRVVGVKIVWTAHDIRSHGPGAKRLERLAAALTARIAHAIIAHCENARAEVLQWLFVPNEKKVFVIPHGHYIDYYENKIDRAKARLILGIPNENFMFLFVGSIWRYKGVIELIDAFRRLPSDDPYLVIAGNSPDALLTDAIRRKAAGGKIKFIPGFVQDDELQIYMNACDVVVLPYQDILTSGAVILAMSFRRPCVAVNRGCLGDVLNNSGAFIYEADSEDGLLHAMERAIDHRGELTDMGRYNQEQACRWGWDYVAQKTLDVYRWTSRQRP
jgi:beta-1,4-mannosyltransferase